MLCALHAALPLSACALQPDSAPAQVKMGKVVGGIDTEYPAWFNNGFLDLREDLAAAKQDGKRLMIMFTMNSCPYCHAMVERNLAQQDIAALLRSKFDVIALNMMGDRNLTDVDGKSYSEKSYAEAMQVRFTPTILFMNEQGEVVLRLNGYLPPPQFKVALDYLMEKSGQLSYRDYVELNAQSVPGAKLNAEPFFLAPPYNLTRQFGNKSGANSKPLALLFEQGDCPNCDSLHRNILTDAGTRKLLQGFDVVQLDMWHNTPLVLPDGKAATARQWAKQLDVKYAPTLILFDASGKEIIRSEAFLQLFHFQTMLDYVLSGSYKHQSNFQRYISQRSEQLRLQGKDVNIWGMSGE